MTKFKIKTYQIVIIFMLAVLAFEAVNFYRGINYVIHKYRWQTTFAKFNSGYFKAMIEQNNLEPNLSQQQVLKILTSHLKVKKTCYNSVQEGCWPEKSFFVNGSIVYSYDSYAGFILDNGILVSGIQNSTANCANLNICNIISIDLNGLNGPNTFGHDQFRFYYYKDKMVPYFYGDDSLVGNKIKRYMNIK
ncbi:MAG: hypothetical protein ACD_20C00325G0001 [uncultured bacterium]|nr:MAG: hypothetical protein ACD_20C00325G0001 [uncultured bacterium]